MGHAKEEDLSYSDSYGLDSESDAPPPRKAPAVASPPKSAPPAKSPAKKPAARYDSSSYSYSDSDVAAYDTKTSLQARSASAARVAPQPAAPAPVTPTKTAPAPESKTPEEQRPRRNSIREPNADYVAPAVLGTGAVHIKRNSVRQPPSESVAKPSDPKQPASSTPTTTPASPGAAPAQRQGSVRGKAPILEAQATVQKNKEQGPLLAQRQHTALIGTTSADPTNVYYNNSLGRYEMKFQEEKAANAGSKQMDLESNASRGSTASKASASSNTRSVVSDDTEVLGEDIIWNPATQSYITVPVGATRSLYVVARGSREQITEKDKQAHEPEVVVVGCCGAKKAAKPAAGGAGAKADPKAKAAAVETKKGKSKKGDEANDRSTNLTRVASFASQKV